MDGGGLPDHTVEVDGHLGDAAVAHELLDDQHDLLGPSDREDGHEHLAAVLGRLLQVLSELLGRIGPGRLDVVVPTVGGFDDQGLQPGEPVSGGVEKPSLLVFRVPGEGDVVESVADVEVGDGGSEDVSRVVEGESHVGGDVRRLVVLERDGVQDLLPHVLGLVGGLLVLAESQLDVVQLEQGHEVPCGRGAVHRPLVAVLEQRRQGSAVVQVGVGYDDGVDVVQRLDLGDAEVGGVLGAGVQSAVDEDLALPRGEQGAGPPDLSEPSHGGDPDPLLAVELGPSESPGDPGEHLLTLVVVGPEVSPDVRDRLGRYRGCADDLHVPSGLLPQVGQKLSLLADDLVGVDGLDQRLACLLDEVDVEDVGRFRDHAPDLRLHRLRVLQVGGVRTDVHPAVDGLGERPGYGVVGGYLLVVVGVDDHERPLELDLLDLNVRGHVPLHLLGEGLEQSVDIHGNPASSIEFRTGLEWKTFGRGLVNRTQFGNAKPMASHLDLISSTGISS